MGGIDRKQRIEQSGEILGYVWAVLPHGLIAVKRPNGSLQALPQADDPEEAVRQFILKDAGDPAGL